MPKSNRLNNLIELVHFSHHIIINRKHLLYLSKNVVVSAPLDFYSRKTSAQITEYK